MSQKYIFLGLFFGFLVITKLNADIPSNDPIVRVDTGYHSGAISAVEPFLEGERLISISKDKTLRIWRARDFKLLKTLRIPIGEAFEGGLDALAVSPNGKLIAVGGWTCWEWDKQSCVYIFDANTGQIIHRIDKLSNIINQLSFSADGNVLAVGMHGKAGILFVDTKTYQILGQDQAYGERLSGASFSNNGFIATAAFDGYLRVYDPAFKLAARIQVPEMPAIADSYFSPDGKHILVGSLTNPIIQILSFPQLQVEHTLRALPEQTLMSLRNAVWSQSGEYIYGSGDSDNTQETEILRWKTADLSHYEVIKIPHRVELIRPNNKNGIVFSTSDASFGVLSDISSIPKLSEHHTLQHPQMSPAFRVSPDGSTVEFPVTQPDKQSLVFAIDKLSLSMGTLSPKTIKQSIPKNLQLTDWLDSSQPKLNGHLLQLEPFEIIRSSVYSTDNKQVFLGTEWSIKAYNKTGKIDWNIGASGAVSNLTVSSDGSLLVAAISDGTVRWYKTSDGKEVLALYVEPQTHEWVLWRPDGYYASSENGDNLIGWHVNRGKDREPDFYRAVQFERQFYRPDLLRQQIGSKQISAATKKTANVSETQEHVATRQATTASIRQQSLPQLQPLGTFTLSQLNDIAPPRINITSATAIKDSSGASELELTIDAEKNSHPMQDVTVYANMLPVAGHKERSLGGNESSFFHRTFRFPISSGDNLIRVEVNNGVSLGLTEQLIEVPVAQQFSQPKGDLYLLAVGVNRFPRIASTDKSKIPDLEYASNDAVALAEFFQKPSVKSDYNSIHVNLLADTAQNQPTRKNILEAMNLLEQAGPNDTVILFLASHGFSDQTGNYYFLPQDGEYADIESVLAGRNLSGQSTSLLSWIDFLDHMRKASGRRVMIVDTCQAKNIFGEFDSKSLRKRSAAALFPLLLASKGDQFSQEYATAKHGLFTYALLDGLNGPADINRDKQITVQELHEFVVPLVELLHDRSGGPQTPQLIAPGSLAKIKLKSTEQ